MQVLGRIGGFLPAAVALTLPLLFLPSAADTYILPRTSLVIAGACLGVGVALLIPRAGHLGNLRLPLAAAAGAAVLAFVFSVSWPLSLAGSYTRYESLPVRLSYLGLLASAVWLIRTPRQRDGVVAGFVAGTSIASLEAVQQALTHVAFRPDGNLGNANLLAALIAMAVPLAVDRARRLTLFVGPWVGAVVVMAAGLFATTSRSGGLGVVAGCLCLLTFALPRRFGVAAGAGSAAVVAVAIVLMQLSPLRALNDDPASLRLHLWGDGLRLLAARPLTGWGEDTTGLTFGHYLTQDYAGLVTFDRVHSGPLDVAVTQGVFGLAALGWVVGVVALAAWRRRNAPDVAGLAGAVAGYSVWVCFNFDWAPATGMFWLLAGVLWSATATRDGPHDRQPSDVKTRDGRDHRGVARAAGAVALAVVAVGLAAFPVVADTWYERGQARLAVAIDPLQAQYHWALGDGLSAAGDQPAGVAELRRAADLGETDPGLYVELGDGDLELGDRTQARRDYERALGIDPYYTPAQQRLAALSSG